MLNRCCTKGFADLGKVIVALFPIVAIDADLDQLMTIQRVVDFLQDCLGKAVLADGNDRIESVGTGAQSAALVSGKLQHLEIFQQNADSTIQLSP